MPTPKECKTLIDAKPQIDAKPLTAANLCIDQTVLIVITVRLNVQTVCLLNYGINALIAQSRSGPVKLASVLHLSQVCFDFVTEVAPFDEM
jgi:hypothetical protein